MKTNNLLVSTKEQQNAKVTKGGDATRKSFSANSPGSKDFKKLLHHSYSNSYLSKTVQEAEGRSNIQDGDEGSSTDEEDKYGIKVDSLSIQK